MSDKEVQEFYKEHPVPCRDMDILQYLRENCVLCYESEEPDSILHTRSQISYDSAVQVMHRFLTDVLIQLMVSECRGYAEAVLYLPERELRAEVSATGMNTASKDRQELFRTKIGIFDRSTWNILSAIPYEQNPVKIFYAHLMTCLKFLRRKLAIQGMGWEQIQPDLSVLELCHIQEVIPLHRMFHLLCGTDELFLEIPS